MRFKLKMLVSVVALAAFCALLAGCGQSPKSVAESFIKGCVKGDTKSCVKLLYDREEAVYAVGMVRMGLGMTEDRKFTYETVYEQDGEAVVEVSGPVDGYFCRVELEKVNGNWLITYIE